MASSTSVLDSKELPLRRRSSNTLCSTNSSCVFHKKKPNHPLANSVRPYVSRSSNSTVTQRVLSARLLKVRSLQSQLNDANFHLNELQQENKALRNLQTRQDKALSRYEGTNADLPKLLKCHEEEIRVLSSKNRSLKKNLRDVMDQNKIREEELQGLREDVRSLTALTKARNLPERHILMKQVEELKEQLKASEEKITLLNRKLFIENKTCKQKLNNELSKSKDVQKDLTIALREIERLSGLTESKNKFGLNNRKKLTSINQKQSISLISLPSNNDHRENRVHIREIDESEENDVEETRSVESDIKLDAFSDSENKVTFSSNLMTFPSDNIKARLTPNPQGHKAKDLKTNITLNGVPVQLPNNVIKPSTPSDPSHRLKKLTNDNTNLEKKDDNLRDVMTKYCSEVKCVVENNVAVVDQLNQDLRISKSETEKLISSLRETDEINSKLRHTKFLAKEPFEIPDKDRDLANQIWNDEFLYRNSISSDQPKNEKIEPVSAKDAKVAIDNKNKLLAKLRAIDNGDDTSFDSVNQVKKHSKVL